MTVQSKMYAYTDSGAGSCAREVPKVCLFSILLQAFQSVITEFLLSDGRARCLFLMFPWSPEISSIFTMNDTLAKKKKACSNADLGKRPPLLTLVLSSNHFGP